MAKKNHSLSKLIFFILVGIFSYYYLNDSSFRNNINSTVNSFFKTKTEVTAAEIPYVPVKAEQKVQNIPVQKPEKPSKASTDNLISLPESLAYPVCPGSKNAEGHQRRDFKHYSICYRESYEQAEWSAYCLEEAELEKTTNRTDDFRPDPAIKTESASLADYKGSGYDRGHLSPAGDFTFSREAMSETFYMSNMSPQTAQFNRGIWKDLESNVRVWARKFGKVYVISGPVLNEEPSAYATIGKNKVSIPKYYYKVILAPIYKDAADKATPEDAGSIAAIGFILPNKKCQDSYFNYACTVDEVEKRTGINFFEELEDSVENQVESSYDLSFWQ